MINLKSLFTTYFTSLAKSVLSIPIRSVPCEKLIIQPQPVECRPEVCFLEPNAIKMPVCQWVMKLLSLSKLITTFYKF